ncbi:MAG TPA: hypothetical protein VNM69_03775 [Bacillus sp. (in: firmicutes)]|nr:hypothetical protein [Bacillus sp. (in: firmicutes)]
MTLLLATAQKEFDTYMMQKLNTNLRVEYLEEIDFEVYSNDVKTVMLSEFIPSLSADYDSSSSETNQKKRYDALLKVIKVMRRNNVRVIFLTSPEAPRWVLGQCVTLGVYDLVLTDGTINEQIITDFYYNPSNEERAKQLLNSLYQQQQIKIVEATPSDYLDNAQLVQPVPPVQPVQHNQLEIPGPNVEQELVSIKKEEDLTNGIQPEAQSFLRTGEEEFWQADYVAPIVPEVNTQATNQMPKGSSIAREHIVDVGEVQPFFTFSTAPEVNKQPTTLEVNSDRDLDLKEEPKNQEFQEVAQERKVIQSLATKPYQTPSMVKATHELSFKTVAFHSLAAGMGSRTISQTYAKVAAERGANVLYVELDYFNPSFAATCGLSHPTKNIFQYVQKVIETGDDIEIEPFIATPEDVTPSKKSLKRTVGLVPNNLHFLAFPKDFRTDLFPEFSDMGFIRTFVGNFMKNLKLTQYDLIVFNLPHQLENFFTVPIMLEVERIYQIMTLQPARMMKYFQLKELLEKMPLPKSRFRLLLNQLPISMGKEEAENILNETCYNVIPYDDGRFSRELDLIMGSPLIDEKVGECLTEDGLVEFGEPVKEKKRLKLFNL